MRGSKYADLRAFMTIMELGTFARAAAQLRISASMLSQRIRELEERFGVQLLNRTTRSVSLTDAGRRLIERIRPAMAEVDAAVEELGSLSDIPRGTVRLHVPRLAAITFIEPVLGRFHQAYPEITLDLAIDDTVTNIVEAGFDVGIRLGELLENDMIAVPLGPHLRQIAVASPEYIAQHGCPETPADLLQHRCINWRQSGSRGIYNWDFQRNGQWFAVAVNGPLVVSDRAFAVSAALQGVGIAYWAEQLVRPFVEAGRLVPLLEDYSPSFPGWHLYYPRQRHIPPAVRVLVDFLKREARAITGDDEAAIWAPSS
ncbi:LysR substrate-binding domain-containing protein [Rhizobium jaguaris]|uniref:LysR family transcriptional regulator n=1 Tax=Rhizobium jaguaris TaxID=1312183 RepID=UPI0039BF8B97